MRNLWLLVGCLTLLVGRPVHVDAQTLTHYVKYEAAGRVEPDENHREKYAALHSIPLYDWHYPSDLYGVSTPVHYGAGH